MALRKRTLSFLVVALVLAAVCVRLGVWQLDRLDRRRARNRPIAERIAAPPSSLADALRDSTTAQYRRVDVRGVYDYANQVAIGPRSNEGSPGVHLVTPLRLAGTDTAILVNRGWVYAADAMTVDPARWREPDSATVTGYLEAYASDPHESVVAVSGSRIFRRLVYDSMATRMPYPLAAFYLIDLSSAAGTEQARASTPVRLGPPSLDEGPHRSYALQWFAFATIAVVGSIAVVAQERRAARSGSVRRT